MRKDSDSIRMTKHLEGKVVRSVEAYPYAPTRVTFTDGTVAVFSAPGQPPTVRPVAPAGKVPAPLMSRVLDA